jgi:hypothetical protein
MAAQLCAGCLRHSQFRFPQDGWGSNAKIIFGVS